MFQLILHGLIFFTAHLFTFCGNSKIIYLSNRYSVPLGTYSKHKEVSIKVTGENRLIIREGNDGPTIANHLFSHEKGKLVQDRQHVRDRTKGITAYIASVAEKFENVELAHDYAV